MRTLIGSLVRKSVSVFREAACAGAIGELAEEVGGGQCGFGGDCCGGDAVAGWRQRARVRRYVEANGSTRTTSDRGMI
jgi:hypothetical protein